VTGLLDLTHAARYCGMSRDTFRQFIADGQGPRPFAPPAIGRRTRWAVSVLDEWMHYGAALTAQVGAA
jgi:predicted DNA-binding transcriptional regulator AlpA